MEKNVPGVELQSVLGLRIERELVIRALQLAGLLLAFNITYAGVQLLHGQRDITRGVVHFVVATILLVVATWRVRQSHEPASLTLPVLNRSTLRQPRQLARDLAASWQAVAWWGLLIAALGLGFAFRLYEILSEPFGVWFDEAQNGIVARQILHGARPMFIGGFTQLPALFFYIFALALKLLGDNVTSLRAVTTAAGILTVLFMYLLARELFDQRVAVLSTFFLAVMRWHVNFSRFAMQGIFAPLFMVTTFYFLVRGLKGKGLWNFAVAGVMAGIGLQSYYSFLLVPFLIGFYLLHHLIFERVLPWQKLALGLGAFVIATAIVYAPLGTWALQHPGEFNQRPQTVSITQNRSASQVAHVAYKSMKQHLLMFNSVGDGNGRHNLPGAPMLDIYTGSLLILGAGYALSRANKSSYFLLLAWVVITLQAGIWSVEFEAPQAFRTVGITPAIAMLAALPLALLWRVAVAPASGTGPSQRKSRLPSASRAGYYALGGVAAFVTVFALIQAGRINFETYFHQQLRDNTVWASFSTDSTFVGKELARLGSDHAVYYSPVYAGQPTIQFLAPSAPSPSPLDVVRDLPLADSRPTAFLLDQTDRPVFDLLKSYYPTATFVEFGPPAGGSPIVFEAVVSSQDLDSVRGLTYRYQGGELSRDGRVPALDLDWSTAPPLPPPFLADWSGVLKVPSYGAYTLEVQAPGPVELRLDGKVVASGEGAAPSQEMRLAQGLHNISVQVEVGRAGPVRLLWQTGGSPQKPVPAAQLYSPPVSQRGLEGSYFSEAKGRHLEFVRIDPLPGGYFHNLPLPVPFTIEWRGHIDIPSGGKYRFFIQAVDQGSLSIDGKVLATTPSPNKVSEASVDLTEGRHDIEIVFQQRGGSPAYMNVSWIPKEGDPQPIPAGLFSPP